MNAQELLGYQFGCAADKGTLVLSNRTKEEAQEAMEGIGLDKTSMEVKELSKTLVKPTKDKRFVLDNISDIANRDGFDAALEYLDTIRDIVRQGSEVAMIVAYEGLHSEEEQTRLKVWADGVMELGFDRQGFGLYPYLKVSKMRGSPDSARFLLFKETPKGLFMESTRRVF